MDINLIKANLREFYNQEAELRNSYEVEDWKIEIRKNYCNLIKSESKLTLLELGAGNDSLFFMNNGLKVIAIDLSSEMVKKCKDKYIETYEMDFYNLPSLNKRFDCIWAMNSLLHVPKSDFSQVLDGINSILNVNGLFYMGVWGGIDSDSEYANEVSNVPRFFSFYSESPIKEILSSCFQIISFEQFGIGKNFDFQSILMRKK